MAATSGRRRRRVGRGLRVFLVLVVLVIGGISFAREMALGHIGAQGEGLCVKGLSDECRGFWGGAIFYSRHKVSVGCKVRRIDKEAGFGMSLGLKLTFVFVFAVAGVRAWALGEPKYVSLTPVQGGFVLEASGKAAPLLVSDQDWP